MDKHEKIMRLGLAFCDVARGMNTKPDELLMALAVMLGSVCSEASDINEARRMAIDMLNHSIKSGAEFDQREGR